MLQPPHIFAATLSVSVAIVIWSTPAAATSCPVAAETYTSLYDENLYTGIELQAAELQQLYDFSAVTLDLLGFFGSAKHCAGPFGTALVCASAYELLIEIEHQQNLSLEKWQSEAAYPPLTKRVIDQFDPLRARHMRVCVVPGDTGDPA